MSQDPKPGTFWRHNKSSNPYVVITLAKIEAGGEAGPDQVVYRRVDENDPNAPPWTRTWIRPLREWESRFTSLVCERCGDERCPPMSVRLVKDGTAECFGWRK